MRTLRHHHQEVILVNVQIMEAIATALEVTGTVTIIATTLTAISTTVIVVEMTLIHWSAMNAYARNNPLEKSFPTFPISISHN